MSNVAYPVDLSLHCDANISTSRCESTREEVLELFKTELLPRLLDVEDVSNIEKFLPSSPQAMFYKDYDVQNIASSAFCSILKDKRVTPSAFTETLLPGIVTSIDNRDPYAAAKWLCVLLDIIDFLPPDLIKKEVLPVAIARGQLSQSPESRVSSCKILGKIATKFNSSQLQEEVVPLVHSLCQDVCGEVRASMCHQLPHIACVLCPDAVKPDLLPLLVDLAIDEEPTVRLAAVHTISCVITLLPADVLKHTIVPLVMKLCDQASVKEDIVLCALSEKFGQLCDGLKDSLSENEKVWFLRFFNKLARLGIDKVPTVPDLKNISEYVLEREHKDLLIQCRHNAASNFPAVIHLSGPSLFEEMLYSTFAAVSCDQLSSVRSCVAGGIHEVLQELGSKCHLVLSELTLLLTDDSQDVLQSLIPNLHHTLQHLNKNGLIGPSIMDSGAREIIHALLKCELVVSLSNNWRLHSAMLGQIEHLPECFSSDLIYSNVCGVLFHRIQDSRALPCRLAAAHALLVLLRHTSKIEHQNELRNRIFTELCIHHSCHVRLLFVKMCGMALDMFSSFYVKDHFFLRLLSLAGDPIPNVRLVLCDLLPRLKALLRMPQDSSLMAALQDAVERLKNSNRPDRDVSAKLYSACQEMDRKSSDSIVSEGVDAEDLIRLKEEQEIEMRSSVPEPRRLVTVNMKTLGDGKRATLVSLLCSDIPRPDFRLSNNSNVAVSNYCVRGGSPAGESKITASISSTSCDLSHNFNSLTSTKTEASHSSNNSWSRSLLTQGSRLPQTNTYHIPKSVSASGTAVTTLYSLLSQNNTHISSAYPVLREEEFYIDAGVPLPEKLTDMKLSSVNLALRSKIPNLRELLFQNSTLLAQVANRESINQGDSSLKSISYLSTVTSSESTSNGRSKRYSRLFSENSSLTDFKRFNHVSRPSSIVKKDAQSPSVLSKPSQARSFHEGDDSPGQNRESGSYSCKVLPSSSTSSRINISRKDSKIGSVNRRSFVYSQNQTADIEGSTDKGRHYVTVGKHNRIDGVTSNHLNPSLDISERTTNSSKMRNGVVNGSPVPPSQNALASTARSYGNISKVSVLKMSYADAVNQPRSTLEATSVLDKDKELSSPGYLANKRIGFREKTHVTSTPPAEKNVSLSSIGVNGVRRPYSSSSRPQSCLILTHNDKANKVNARSLSQESLGVDHNKVGTRILNRTATGFSRIPRGGPGPGARVGTSCHSSPGSSRCTSPTHGLASRTAPCSPGGSRSTSPSRPRVSLASIKLHEPSKLPIRKYNHHV